MCVFLLSRVVDCNDANDVGFAYIIHLMQCWKRGQISNLEECDSEQELEYKEFFLSTFALMEGERKGYMLYLLRE